QLHGLSDAGERARPGCGALCGILPDACGVAGRGHQRSRGGCGRDRRSRGADRPAQSEYIAGLRFRGDHRRMGGPAERAWRRAGRTVDGVALHRRRIGASHAPDFQLHHAAVPGDAAVLPPWRRRIRELSPASPLSPAPLLRLVRQALWQTSGSNDMNETLIPILVGTVAAATPLILAGLGELVTERSGVINLGVEGM